MLEDDVKSLHNEDSDARRQTHTNATCTITHFHEYVYEITYVQPSVLPICIV